MVTGKSLFAGSAYPTGAAVPVLFQTDHGRAQQTGKGVPSGADGAGDNAGMGKILPPVLQHLTDAGIARQLFQLQNRTLLPGNYIESIYYNPFPAGRKELFSKITAVFSESAISFSTQAVCLVENPVSIYP
jgi:hypothetical protein